MRETQGALPLDPSRALPCTCQRVFDPLDSLFGDFKEQRGFAALDVEHLQQFFVRHLLEHHARTGGDVGLCAFLGGGVRGVDRQRFARAEQVLLRLVLRQTHLDVVLVLVLHAREDEHARVRRAVGIGGADEIGAGEGVDGVHQLIAGQGEIPIVARHRRRGERIRIFRQHCRHRRDSQHKRRTQRKQLLHKTNPSFRASCIFGIPFRIAPIMALLYTAFLYLSRFSQVCRCRYSVVLLPYF